MKDLLKYFQKIVMRFLLKIYWIFPIKKKTIFFMANMGKSYLCNPKYIYESMISDKRFNKYKFIWCFKEPNKIDKNVFNSNTKIIKKGNLFKYFYYLLTSDIIIYNCGGFSYAPIRKKQFLIETWHGGGASKRCGLTVANKSKASKKGITIASRDIKLFLSSSKISSKYVIHDSLDYHGEILESGFPRNDLLFVNDTVKTEKIRKELKIDSSVHIVLYAPTFKGSEDKAVNVDHKYEVIDPVVVKAALSKRFGGDWVFLCRGHQYANDMGIPNSDGDVSLYPDMQELLLVADVLITDYSSSIWDYAITRKPSFLFVPDLERYKNDERGFLIPIQKWPAIIAHSNSELSHDISMFNADEYKNKINDFIKQAGSYERGDACNIVKQRILDR